jgi:hypothetical protein
MESRTIESKVLINPPPTQGAVKSGQAIAAAQNLQTQIFR